MKNPWKALRKPRKKFLNLIHSKIRGPKELKYLEYK